MTLTFTKPPFAYEGGDYAKIGEPPKRDDIRRCQYKLRQHHGLTLTESQLLRYTGKTRWADVRALSSASVLWAWKQERKQRQSALERYLDALKASYRAYRELRQNVVPMLPAGKLRKEPPIPFAQLVGFDRFKIGEWVNIPYGARARIAAVRNEYITVHVPGLEGRAVRGYRRELIEAWNPAPELEQVA